MDEIIKKLERLEYHQKLLINMLQYSNEPFTKLIVLKGLSEEEVCTFHSLCEELSNKLEEQKAEGFVYFNPLLDEFSNRLNPKLHVRETVEACYQQRLHVELMSEFIKVL